MSVNPPCQRIEISSPPGLCQIWLGSFTLILAWSQLLVAHSGIAGMVAPLCGTSPVQNLAGPSESTVNSAWLAAVAGFGLTATIDATRIDATATGCHRRRRDVMNSVDIPTVCDPTTAWESAGRSR